MSLPDSFAHLINLEFFDDLLSILQSLVQSGVSNEPAFARLGPSSISAPPKSVGRNAWFLFPTSLDLQIIAMAVFGYNKNNQGKISLIM